jgi:hypothetical protein
MVPRSLISPLAIGLLVVGVLLAVVGVVYLTTAASHLPSFFPGHLAPHRLRNGQFIRTHASKKKGIFALFVAVLVFGGAWFLKYRYQPVD